MVNNTGRPRAEFDFGYEDLTRCTGLERSTSIQHRLRGHFDPENFESVMLYVIKHAHPELRKKLVLSLAGLNDDKLFGPVPDIKKNARLSKRRKKA